MPNQNQRIQLISPVMSNIPGFVLDNSKCTVCGGLQTKLSTDPKVTTQIIKMLRATSDRPDLDLKACTCETPTLTPLVQKDQYKGKTVCICGSGPSLARSARRIRRGEFDHVWGCNDALMWLTANGYPCTHGVGIDQSPDLYEQAWKTPPNVPYLLATSVDPKLCQHLKRHGRTFSHFHSFIGFDNEHHLYGLLYDFTVIAGEGLNVVNRAIGVAEFMGYDMIYVAGADCSFGPGDTFHVMGDKVEGIILRGEVDGQKWSTKPDMLISAISLVETQKRMGPRIKLLGNVLPKALKHKDREFLDRCIRWETEDERARAQAVQFAPKLDSDKIQELLDKKG